MTITLPTTPGAASVRWSLLDWGGEMPTILGGATMRIARLGSRHMLTVTMPPMKMEPDGRIWTARLRQGKIDGDVLFAPTQVDFDAGAPGSPKVDGATTTGPVLPIKGLTPGYQIKEGQWLSIVHAGRRYFHIADDDQTADGSGEVTIAVTPHLRAAMANNDVIELAEPKIEGLLEGDSASWTVDNARAGGLLFAIVERK